MGGKRTLELLSDKPATATLTSAVRGGGKLACRVGASPDDPCAPLKGDNLHPALHRPDVVPCGNNAVDALASIQDFPHG